MNDRNDVDRDRAGVPRGTDRRFVLVPALTFLVGLLLGAVVVWVGLPSDDGTGDGGRAGQPSPSPTVATSPTESPGAVVTIAAACLRAADGSSELLALLREAVSALGDLDARRLEQLVDRMEELDGQIRRDARDCRQGSSVGGEQ